MNISSSFRGKDLVTSGVACHNRSTIEGKLTFLMKQPTSKFDRPLAERMRPIASEDVVGQESFWRPGSSLWRLVEEDRFSSLIFWGPPGTGKTSLATVIGHRLGREVVVLSAVSAGVKDIREVLGRSQALWDEGKKTILLFMDEIHRLSRNQQDVLLPALETGIVRFIGATTENPSFEVNAAVLSRSLTFQFKALSIDALREVLRRACERSQEAFGGRRLDDEVLAAIARAARGDARSALNLLDAVVASCPREGETITLEETRSYAEALPLRYDKDREAHYDVISAFIKSIRATSPDGALHYLARMIASGEDPVFIARRLVISASEDVGNANPTALLVATAAMEAVSKVGMPEARIILAQATTYLASSPKSNRSYLALEKALEDVREGGPFEVPLHLRNAPTRFMKEIGYGKGYVYAHDDPEAASRLEYLPQDLRGRSYYDPGSAGAEKALREVLEQVRSRKRNA
jgi:putative ATPase